MRVRLAVKYEFANLLLGFGVNHHCSIWRYFYFSVMAQCKNLLLCCYTISYNSIVYPECEAYKSRATFTISFKHL
jgi:hypothetical protein